MEEDFPFEKAVFNSDMMNDENHIYFDFYSVTQGFGFVKWPINGDVKVALQTAVHKLNEYAETPTMVMVPFKYYHEEVVKETPEKVLANIGLRGWCKMFGLQLYVMTPDYLKNHVRI